MAIDYGARGLFKKSNIQLTKMLQHELNENLYNKNDINNVKGYYLNPSDGALVVSNDYTYSHLIPIQNGQTYIYPVDYGTFGAGSTQLFLFNTNGVYIGNATGTLVNNNTYNVVTINNLSAKYARVNVNINNMSVFMFIERDTYPNKYISYCDKDTFHHSYISSETLRYINPLYEKIAIFDGDSICHGVSANDGKGGWAGRIGNKNNMAWVNYGLSGGTITANTYADTVPRHWICRNVANMRSDADYIIFEGGVNDASLNVTMGTITEGWNDTYNDTTFCGALESTFRQAVIKYLGKKIGFIIVHKMDGASVQTQHNLYFDKVKTICNKWSIPYLDLFNQSTLNVNITEIKSSLFSDTWHLNSNGYDVITPKIEAWMKTL